MPKINVCPKCLKESCSGDLYKLEKPMAAYGVDIGDWNFYECQTFIAKDGKRYYHLVIAHGAAWDVKVKKVEDENR